MIINMVKHLLFRDSDGDIVLSVCYLVFTHLPKFEIRKKKCDPSDLTRTILNFCRLGLANF